MLPTVANRLPVRRAGALLVAALAGLGAFAVCAQPARAPQSAASAASDATVVSSALDAPLFYQLLIGEIELSTGEAGNAYAVMLDAARRTRDPALFKRAVDVAIQARAGEQALAAARAWREALPQSSEPLRYELQLLAALNRGADIAEPIKALLARTPDAERSALIGTLPRLFQRLADKRQFAVLLDDALQPHMQLPVTRTAALVAAGRAWLLAAEPARALVYADQAWGQEPSAATPVLLALELMPSLPAAERLVQRYLQGPTPDTNVQMAYVRALGLAHRYVDAIAQLQQITRHKPDQATAWFSLGALQLELRQTRDAEVSLQRFLALRATATAGGSAAAQDDDDDDSARGNDGGHTQALLMLAQAADQRGDAKAAAAWLDKIDNPQRALEVQTRRALLLARQGKIAEARALVQQVPERRPEDARAKLMAEVQVLRDVQRWSQAYDLLLAGSQRAPADTDLLYEQAMMAEKMQRPDEMERLLRRVIELKPDHHHAYNALGYSLADRNQRLTEAHAMIKKALELAPGDPFITDSLGWVEYRMGNREEAVRLLRRAYASRPDAEIAAHLGEVLWATGAHDEARRIWREGRDRDASNEVLRETLARLQVRL